MIILQIIFSMNEFTNKVSENSENKQMLFVNYHFIWSKCLTNSFIFTMNTRYLAKH